MMTRARQRLPGPAAIALGVSLLASVLFGCPQPATPHTTHRATCMQICELADTSQACRYLARDFCFPEVLARTACTRACAAAEPTPSAPESCRQALERYFACVYVHLNDDVCRKVDAAAVLSLPPSCDSAAREADRACLNESASGYNEALTKLGGAACKQQR